MCPFTICGVCGSLPYCARFCYTVSLNRDVAVQNSISWDSLNALPNRDGYVFNERNHLVDASIDIMQQEREGEGRTCCVNKGALAKGYC